ncbi:MAG: hypothetical protein IT532_00145 [Burkholderiales bacterium]|nr:hypothetical protein [Burkholderiales bacterium]
MSRTRVDLQPTGALSPRELLWQQVRDRRDFTLMQLIGSTGIHKRTVQSYLQGLLAGGYVQDLRADGVYRLVRDVGVEAPRVDAQGRTVTQGSGREALWRTMKVLGSFTARELALHASTEQHLVAEEEANTYIKFLSRAGYLRCIEPARTPRQARYLFVRARNSGPRAPMIQRVKQVFDPNLGKVVYVEPTGGRDG